MPTPFFRFKQFTVRHDKCAMKVGTDGVLLGCVANGEKALSVLDVGTGTGLVALMIAQRFPEAKITAIDIDSDAVEQARENVEASCFAKRIEVREQDFNNIECWSSKYDLIVSNPPFYEENVSCPDARRDAARHTDSLPLERLIKNAATLLNEGGVFAVIIPQQRASDFILNCSLNKLYLWRRTDVKTTPKKMAKRTILQFTNKMVESHTETLMLNDESGKRSVQYQKISKDFYLDKTMDYKAIIDKYYPENNELKHILVVHSRRVADKALAIVDKHPELKADREFVEEAAMLHDLGIFRCDADGIQCFGDRPYICHGTIGGELLRREGFPRHARVCERHTGAGLSKADIVKQNLPIPPQDLLPETIEEQIICYADKFFSKTKLEKEKTVEQALRSIAKFGDEGAGRFMKWAEMFE